MSNRATSTSTPAMPPQATTMTPQIPKDRIAMRAYEKWMKGGCKEGCDKQNWLEAEAELKAEMARPAAAARR
jgi:hypothetical protein